MRINETAVNQMASLTGETTEEGDKELEQAEFIHFRPAPLTEEEAKWADMWYQDERGKRHQVYWGSAEDFKCPEGWQSVMAIRLRIKGVEADIFVKKPAQE